MSAAEDDTELRDLLLQNLENSGVLNKLKAQMRAAVFMALEEQDRVQNKSPLVNENLKNCLNTKEGRLVASLVLDFLQVFDLDFTRAVFEPEIDSKNLESREVLCKELGLGPDLNSKTPVILELLRRQHKDQARDQARDQTQVSEPRAKGDLVLKRDLDLEEVDDGDSFFDDPLPQPQKTYGCPDPETDDSGPGPVLRRDKSLSDLSVLGPRSDQDSEFRKPESPVQSLSLGRSSSSEPSRTGVSNSKEKGPKDSKPQNEKSGSQHLDEDVEYDDDFNSHRSDLSRSELSIGEGIEEVSIEGPDPSDKFDEATQDLSVSQLSHAADYMEDVP